MSAATATLTVSRAAALARHRRAPLAYRERDAGRTGPLHRPGSRQGRSSSWERSRCSAGCQRGPGRHRFRSWWPAGAQPSPGASVARADFEIADRDAQIGIGLERARDVTVERRIAEQPPPIVGHGSDAGCRVAAPHRQSRRAARDSDDLEGRAAGSRSAQPARASRGPSGGEHCASHAGAARPLAGRRPGARSGRRAAAAGTG